MTKDEKRAYDQARYERIKADPALHDRKKAQARSATKAYYWRDPAAAAERARKSRKANPESVKARKRRHWFKHLDRNIAKQKARYQPEVSRAASRRWYAANREYAIRRGAEWSRANPELKTHYANKRRAQKMASAENHTLAQWRQLVVQCDHMCTYCGRKDRPLTRDHKIPLNRGGSDGISNITPACRSCNAAKGQRTDQEFSERITQ